MTEIVASDHTGIEKDGSPSTARKQRNKIAVAGKDAYGIRSGQGGSEAAATVANTAVEQAAAEHPEMETLISRYFRHIPAEDLPTRAEDVVAVVTAHQRLAQHRSAGSPKIRVFNPQNADDAWSAGSTIVNIVNDDMPYLVDSVISTLTEAGAVVLRVLHPILDVRRDSAGTLVEVLGSSAKSSITGGFRGRDVVRESWAHILIDRITDAERAEKIELEVAASLSQVRDVVEDTDEMARTAKELAVSLRRNPPPLAAQEIIEAADLLDWFADGHLTFVGYQQCDGPTGTPMTPAPTSGLGLLRDNASAEGFTANMHSPLDHNRLMVLTRSSAPTSLAKNAQPFYLALREFDEDGVAVGEHQFIGLLTPRALNAEVQSTPVLRRVVDEVLLALGSSVDSYTGQRALDLLATYPRAELFWASVSEVVELVRGVLQLTSRRALRIFLQADPYRRFVSALVFLPRDRYTTAGRLAMMKILLDELQGSDIRYTARVGDSALAAVHFIVTTNPESAVVVDLPRMTEKVRQTIRTWEDELVAAIGGDEVLDTAGERTRYVEAFDQAYKADYSPASAVMDLQLLDALRGPEDLALSIIDSPPGRGGNRRLKAYVTGGTVTLSRALPLLQSMGAEVIDENPYQVTRTDGTPSRIYDFGLQFPDQYLADDGSVLEVRARFTDAFTASWSGLAEVDGFNTLVLAADLNWRQVAVFRAYAHYLRQIGSPYTQGYIESVITTNPAIATSLARLFQARFDPAEEDGREETCDTLAEEITVALDLVSSLDADRILRSFLRLILATDRTNAFRTDSNERLREFISFKLNPRKIPDLPKPVPVHEIWVYSPRLEGVHLRFGDVARGGLRWSDRPEDFRTEVLGLVKAQEVKNAVIVPVGAKGGFVLKQAPAPTGDPVADRDALAAEGINCYKMFIQGMLDVTDNRVDGEIVPPKQVVRHDEDDPYLVVAADKGTAKFSDTANAVAADNGFWLDDAFASGGSAGYDHKGMGITARGAWESVKHHFRELGVDTQTENFTVVGVGDMSGDVFGNGMLRSEHIALVAAFDHRHIFVDPAPDAAASFVERRRLFDLPRSSWADYEPSLISAGGGVFSRTLKNVPITAQMREVLGLDDDITHLTPNELMHAVLLAPVDLLWNGGVGTYVKASTESDTQVGDKANDPVRVNGGELRVKVVGEGGNLGVTQLGRIEFARIGGRINTDAIDNSAGVDTSDHEVNIKIALQPLLSEGTLTVADRDALLVSMTDEVAELVLADNIDQNRVLGVIRLHAPSMLNVHARLIDDLVARGNLDRGLEFLPTQAQINQRGAAGEGLTSPELSVLLSYVKADLSKEMIRSELPELSAFADQLPDYFPQQMRDGYGEAIAAHPLRREIVTTMTANEVVNGGGLSFVYRLTEEVAATAIDSIRSYRTTTKVFGLPELWADIAEVNNVVPAAVQDRLTLETRRLLDRAARWFLSSRPQPLDVTAEIERYAAIVHALTPRMPRLLVGVEHETVHADVVRLQNLGAPADLAHRVAYALFTFSLLDVVDVAIASGREPQEVAELYFALSAHLGLDNILSSVSALDRGDRWHALARQAVRDGLYSSLRAIVADVLSSSSPEVGAQSKIDQWEQDNRFRLERARRTLGQIAGSGANNLAALSVAAREINSLVR
ncbi:NAD-glutamate dehydrogenase [Nakamurella antarctica]|uniref:NAD-glutamate dehydrogenase n=1 Tax=Nakamurella antarctica TaxID=1902245 RepID=A0A3G8ZLU6_9ACTN|nr:NAD-glutamate dehydrogenase [Nakamurella antarctica]AZI58312.1 NAD-glutamate dehydrogenase [Nakamurella antarctica]